MANAPDKMSTVKNPMGAVLSDDYAGVVLCDDLDKSGRYLTKWACGGWVQVPLISQVSTFRAWPE
jgi:hypothetical protein